jgi:hypothetical protein
MHSLTEMRWMKEESKLHGTHQYSKYFWAASGSGERGLAGNRKVASSITGSS